MRLRDGVLAVRFKLGEVQPWLWSDDEIIDELNVSARRMTSAAQTLEGFYTFNTEQDATTGSWKQEYPLPLDVDQITGVAYLSGTMFPILPTARESIQVGGVVGGIPMYFYMKDKTRILTPMSTQGGGIAPQPLPPNDGGDARISIGLYPIPNSVLPIYVWYQSWHPQMKTAFDECQVPDRFKQAWVAYAIARCKEKESALDEAAYYDAQHVAGTQEYIEYAIDRGQQITPPQFNRVPPGYFLRGSNSIIVVTQNPGNYNL